MEFKENLDVAGCAIDFIADYTEKHLQFAYMLLKYIVLGENVLRELFMWKLLFYLETTQVHYFSVLFDLSK